MVCSHDAYLSAANSFDAPTKGASGADSTKIVDRAITLLQTAQAYRIYGSIRHNAAKRSQTAVNCAVQAIRLLNTALANVQRLLPDRATAVTDADAFTADAPTGLDELTGHDKLQSSRNKLPYDDRCGSIAYKLTNVGKLAQFRFEISTNVCSPVSAAYYTTAVSLVRRRRLDQGSLILRISCSRNC